MQEAAGKAGALYILGDLFENFWLGVDDQTPPNPDIISELKRFTESGKSLYIVRGNRDLMLDKGIESLTGATLLPDLSLIELDGKPVLISHGDVLCTRDVIYQVYRKIMEAPPVKWLFLRLPYSVRRGLVGWLSPAFKQSARLKKPEIMDVTTEAVVHVMRKFNVDELVHGHTHRPRIHDLVIDDRPARRIVLGDWYDDELILVCNGKDRKLMRVEEYLHY